MIADLHIHHTSNASPRGLVLLLPGADDLAGLLGNLGFHTALSPETDLPGLIQTLQHLASCDPATGRRTARLILLARGERSFLAARAVQLLRAPEQPDDLILLDPLGLERCIPGTVLPAAVPPFEPRARLLVITTTPQGPDLAVREYTKKWTGFDGYAVLAEEPAASADLAGALAETLKPFLDNAPGLPSHGSNPNPAAVPVESYSPQRHAEKVLAAARGSHDLLFIGDSIINNLEYPEFQPVWQQFYAPRNALNLGFGGYRTENLLWNLLNGELEGQDPKAVVIQVGTNNIDEKNYPTRHTASQLAGGILALVDLIKARCPRAKIIVLKPFPGCYDGPHPTSHRAILDRAAQLVAARADGERFFFWDVNHVFLNRDGSTKGELMPDWLHPSLEGARLFARALEPLLCQVMGDESRDTDQPANTAVVPVPKLEEDSYDWWVRHRDVLACKDRIDPEIVLIGDSITHFWGGQPELKWADGNHREPNGPESWELAFGGRRVLNLGFGWDRTQNVLWRLDHGQLEGLHPRLVVIHIGTNNTSETPHARMNTPEEICQGVQAIVGRVRTKVPTARIVLMAVFPREQAPDNWRRLHINLINRQLQGFAQAEGLDFVDLAPAMLCPDGTLSQDLAGDFCHPSDKGYRFWAEALQSFVREA